MVVLSKRYNLPIIPLYLDAYNMNKPIRLSVGNPIWEVTDAPETINYIRSELIRLKDKGTSLSVSEAKETILDDENDGMEISPVG